MTSYKNNIKKDNHPSLIALFIDKYVNYLVNCQTRVSGITNSAQRQ
jgi:hypothetical protein